MKFTPVRVIVAVAATALVTACGGGTTDTVATAGADSPATSPSSLRVEEAWVRATSGSEDPSMTAAFMIIWNDGDSDIDLVAAESAVAGSTELHEMASVDGAMVMRQVEGGLTITAGRGKTLAPGGHHVMLMDLEEELTPGAEVELTLVFSDGSRQAITAPVKAFTEEEGHYHAPGEGDHTHGPDDAGGMGGMEP